MTKNVQVKVKSFGFSPEINLIDTVSKQTTARLQLIKVELNPPLGGPYERRRAGLLVKVLNLIIPVEGREWN
jgi:hypothetical protein